MISPWTVLALLLLLLQTVFPQNVRPPPGTSVWRQTASECAHSEDCPSLEAQKSRGQKLEGYGYTSDGTRLHLCCTEQCPPDSPQESPPVFRSPTGERQPEEGGRDTKVPPGTTEVQGQSGCGLRRTGLIKPYDLGAEESTELMWPWMVAVTNITDQEHLICSAFLIDRRHALSAAICFRKPNASQYNARIGNPKWQLGQELPILSISVHEGYQKGLNYDDIALITFAEEVDDPKVSPICLSNTRLDRRVLDGLGTTAAGWGATSDNWQVSETLHHLSDIPVISNSQCSRILARKVSNFNYIFPRGITRGILCAGFLEGGKDMCGGDAGAPLMVQDEGRWTAVGIVSFGVGCGKVGYPSGYTRISEYLPWIKTHLALEINSN